MTLERVSELTSAPVVGQFYLVPTVTYPWLMDKPSFTKAWPVLGGKHEDAEHLGFADEHYHVDSRFVSARDYERAMNRNYRGVVTFEGTPLSMRGHYEGGVWRIKPHPPVVWQRRKCMRDLHRPTRVRELGVRIDAVYAGKTCKHGKGGFICPHKGLALGTVPVVDGIITCPLHGLRIDAETGLVQPTPERDLRARTPA